MNKKHILLASLFSVLPVLAFATTGGGDTTFSDITTQLKNYLGGSLGLLFVLLGFLGAAAAVAGYASMKTMFPVFGLTLALRYGPAVLETISGATGDYTAILHHANAFTPADLAIVMISVVLFVIANERRTRNKEVAAKDGLK